MTKELEIKFTSWNCRGLQNYIKLKQIMGRLKSIKSQIIFLQEIHLSINEDIRLRTRWQGKVLSAPFNTQARGVATLIHRSIPLNITNVPADKAGRYLIVQGVLLSEFLNLVNIYVPNQDDPEFFNNLFLNFFKVSYPHTYTQIILKN